jgi:hypothetical protein
MKAIIFWNVLPCNLVEGTNISGYHVACMCWVFCSLNMEAAIFAKMLVVMNQTTPHHNPQGNLNSHRNKNVKSCCIYTSASDRHCTEAFKVCVYTIHGFIQPKN